MQNNEGEEDEDEELIVLDPEHVCNITIHYMNFLRSGTWMCRIFIGNLHLF